MDRLRITYAAETRNNTRSDPPLTMSGVSDVMLLYVIHSDDAAIFIIENSKE
jgi:hypothetical protein